MTGTPTNAGPRKADQKLPYRKPRLIVYGDLRQLTQAKAGNKTDGASVPPTKK